MLSNMIHLPETDFTPNYSLTKIQSLPKTICLSEVGCLPAYQLMHSPPHSTSFTMKILPGADILGTCNHPDSGSWAEIEFSHAELGDARRRQRLIQLAQQRGAAPNISIPQACGSHAATKAAYRFYDNDAIKAEAILHSHQKATLERMSNKSLVLAIQDTTEVDYTHHPATKGLGTLHDTNHYGLLVHTTLAVTPERVPLGIIQQQVWTRPAEEFGKKHTRKQRPIEEKESYKWLNSLKETAKLQQQFPHTHVVSIGDREADVYELFVQAKELSQDILVRASWNRCVDHPQKYLWDHLQSRPVAGTLTITVPRKQNQPQREATLSIHYAKVTLRPPQRPKGQKLPTITVWSVYAYEEQSPQGIKPIEWLILTTVPVFEFSDACECIQWYTCRWVIELYHKVLKSGCRIEERQFDDVARIKRYIAVDDVVAWRVLFLTILGREVPDIPCDAVLEAHEWQALYCFIHKTNTPPQQPPTLKEATLWIAQLGGFLARKSDGQPGVTLIWRGLQRLQDLAAAWQLFRTNSS